MSKMRIKGTKILATCTLLYLTLNAFYFIRKAGLVGNRSATTEALVLSTLKTIHPVPTKSDNKIEVKDQLPDNPTITTIPITATTGEDSDCFSNSSGQPMTYACLKHRHLPPMRYTYTRCAKKLRKRKGLDEFVDLGSFTPNRLQKGCCQKLELVAPKTLVEHFPLNVPGAKEYLNTYFNASVPRFTILRHPVSQFISYFFMKPKGHQIIETVDRLYAMLSTADGKQAINNITDMGSLNSIPDDLQHIRVMITNSQAKELGWEEGADVEPIVAYLRQLQLIGLSEYLFLSWISLQRLMGWPVFALPRATKDKAPGDWRQFLVRECYPGFRAIWEHYDLEDEKTYNIHTQPIPKYKLNSDLRRKIEAIQHADMKLYAEARKIFRTQFRF